MMSAVHKTPKSYCKSEVYRQGESPEPCGAPVLLTTCSDTLPLSLTNIDPSVRENLIQEFVKVL